jgi:hypothetical protein
MLTKPHKMPDNSSLRSSGKKAITTAKALEVQGVPAYPYGRPKREGFTRLKRRCPPASFALS